MRIKQKLSVPRSLPSLFRLRVLKLCQHVFEYLMTISPPPTPPCAVLFFTQRLVSGHVYEVNMAITSWSSWSPFLSIRKSKYQRDMASKMKQLCCLTRTSHSSRSLGVTGYFLRWNRRGKYTLVVFFELMEEMVAWECRNGRFNEQFQILPLELKV